jgi:hypothetical protein
MNLETSPVRLAATLFLGTALCAAAAIPAAAQTPAQAAPAAQPASAAAPAANPAAPHPAFTAPRTTFGQPDISGYWSNATLTPMSRNRQLGDRATFTEDEVKTQEDTVQVEIQEGNQRTDPSAGAEYRNPTTVNRAEFSAAGGAVGGYNRGWLDPGNHVMRVNGQPRTSLLTTPNGQVPAPTVTGAAAAGGRPAAPARPAGLPDGGTYGNPETRSAGERCLISFGRNGGPPMFGNGFYNNNYQIVQTPTNVMILVEMNHDARIVRLNGTHRTDGIRPWFGDSIGRWDGDTLVVETTNIPRGQQFGGSWENLKVTERFKRVAEDRLYYSFTIEDPTRWNAPWGGEYEFSPLNGVIYEYACHEGNYALPGILSGMRIDQERAAAARAAAPAAAATPAAPAASPAAPASPAPRQ